MEPSTTLEEDAASLNDAARMVLAEMKANPDHEVSLLVQAFVECDAIALGEPPGGEPLDGGSLTAAPMGALTKAARAAVNGIEPMAASVDDLLCDLKRAAGVAEKILELGPVPDDDGPRLACVVCNGTDPEGGHTCEDGPDSDRKPGPVAP